MPCGSAKDSNQQDKNGENGRCAFEDLDHSILQHSFSLGVTNVQQILKCIQNGTKEIKDIILNECNIIYECKVCANLFRSLANFLYHKRCYCKKHLCEGMPLFENFEENATVVVQPEPPDKEPMNEGIILSSMTDCTVDLVKAKVVQGKVFGNSDEDMDILQQELRLPKEKAGKGKGNKLKEPIEDESKKVAKPTRTVSPMISRRTRLKNSVNASKRALKPLTEVEPPKKSVKTLIKATASLKAPTVQIVEMLKESDPPSNESKEQKKVKTENIKIVEPVNVRLNEPAKLNEPATVNVAFTVRAPTKIKGFTAEPDVIILSDTEENNDKIIEKEHKNSSENNVGDMPCGKSSKQIYVKPVKNIIIPKSKSVDMKCTVFDNIRKNIKTNKLGFTNITNAAGKSLQCFPQYIFKTIDGNPHAVFQSTDSTKSDSVAFKGKQESSKKDGEKLILLLKKNPNTSVPEQKPIPEKSSKSLKNQNEFHLTRRKRLLQRSDCNVQELKCLTCNAQFTSLKTLYFHMLSIHSKKRLYYPCPFCKTLFVQMYGVTRHLVSIHNKTKEQINKLRDVIKKKSVWRKVDDVNIKGDEVFLNECKSEKVLKDEPKPEIKYEDPLPKQESSSNDSGKTFKSPIKLSKDVLLHQCSKCGRSFGRKSSQVSHEKFCIMNAIKVETVDLTGGAPISPPPNMTFLSLSPKKVDPDQFQQPVHQQNPPDTKVSTRPKRGAEKQMHKDFVDSQTLKWRSANTNFKASTSTGKKTISKNIEKKVLNIMSVENLLCTKCDKTFSSYSNLRRHVAIHVGWTRFKCKHCEYQAYNKSQCWAHVQKSHGVSEENLEKSVISISKNPMKKSLLPNMSLDDITKSPPELKAKGQSPKMNGVPKVKISKKKSSISVYAKADGIKKGTSLKKGNFSKKDRMQFVDSKKEVSDSKDKIQNTENKKVVLALKKEKCFTLESRKEPPAKKDKIQNVLIKKDMQGTKQDKMQNIEIKKCDSLIVKKANEDEKCDSSEKKEKNRPLGPLFKFSVPQFKRDGSNYKSVTTNNPTTIILSKKFSSPTIQSILAVSPESLSSTAAGKAFPLRSSPRKSDGKAPEENSLTSLVTRSSAYTKSGPIAIKMPVRSNSTEEQQKNTTIMPEKVYTKKDKLISEWFPKKDLNSNTRRESAPLIIGLVPAANTTVSPRAKSPAFSQERNQN